MKKIAFIIISCFLLTLIGCKKNYLNNGWNLVNKIDFNKSFDDNSEIISEVLLNFRHAQNMRKSDWKEGYVQEIQFYEYLYFRNNLVTKDAFMNNVRAVYDKFYKKHPESTKNIFSYSIFLYLDGKKEESLALLRKIYKKDYEYNLKELSNADIKNFVCGILLNDIEPSEYEETLYCDFCYPSENDLIEMLQITW